MSTIYKGMADFMVLQIIGLLLLMLFPEIALCSRAGCSGNGIRMHQRTARPPIGSRAVLRVDTYSSCAEVAVRTPSSSIFPTHNRTDRGRSAWRSNG